jgi:hypothetical protein
LFSPRSILPQMNGKRCIKARGHRFAIRRTVG